MLESDADPIDRLVVELRGHRQREHLGTETIRDIERRTCDLHRVEHAVRAVQRQEVRLGADALRCQLPLDPVTLRRSARDPQDEVDPAVVHTVADLLVLQAEPVGDLGVQGGDAVAAHHQVVQHIELVQCDDGVQFVHERRACPPEGPVERCVGGQYHRPAGPTGRQDLGEAHRERVRRRLGADGSTVDGAAEGCRGVGQKWHARCVAFRLERRIVEGVTEGVHRDHHRDVTRRQRGPERDGVHRPVFGVDVHEADPVTELRHDLGGCGEGERRKGGNLPRPGGADERSAHDPQSVGAAGGGEKLSVRTDLQLFGESGLELGRPAVSVFDPAAPQRRLLPLGDDVGADGTRRDDDADGRVDPARLLLQDRGDGAVDPGLHGLHAQTHRVECGSPDLAAAVLGGHRLDLDCRVAADLLDETFRHPHQFHRG